MAGTWTWTEVSSRSALERDRDDSSKEENEMDNESEGKVNTGLDEEPTLAPDEGNSIGTEGTDEGGPTETPFELDRPTKSEAENGTPVDPEGDEPVELPGDEESPHDAGKGSETGDDEDGNGNTGDA